MSETKTYIFPENGGMSDNSGVISQLIANMRNNGGFGDGNSFLWVIFLFFLYGWGGRGFGGFGGGVENQINNDYGRTLLLQAINGNGAAINQLASTLNCDINAIQTALSALQSNVQNVGTQVGMSGQAVINAIQSGNASLASQLSQCCCDNKLLTVQQGYDAQLRTLDQTNVLGGKIDAQTIAINNQFCALKEREMQGKIDALMEKNTALQNSISNANQTAQIQAYISSVVNPIASDVAALKAAAPPTVAVPYPQLSAVPTAFLNGGFYGANVFANGGQWA